MFSLQLLVNLFPLLVGVQHLRCAVTLCDSLPRVFRDSKRFLFHHSVQERQNLLGTLLFYYILYPPHS